MAVMAVLTVVVVVAVVDALAQLGTLNVVVALVVMDVVAEAVVLVVEAIRRLKDLVDHRKEVLLLQPVVVVHPRTGRRGLYVSPTFTTRIDGMHADESVSLLRFLYEWIARPEFCTRVSWRPNQVVMWDNRALAHKGLADDVSQPRVVQRVSIRGTAPVNYRGQSFSEKVKVQAAPPSLFDWAEGKLSQQQQQQ